MCKIWGHWPKALGHSKTKCLKMLKNAKFWTPNFMLSSNLDFQSHWTFKKISISMNLLMENRFSKPVSMCTLSLSKNEIDEKCKIFQTNSKLNFEKIGLSQANEIFHAGTYWGQVQACKILWYCDTSLANMVKKTFFLHYFGLFWGFLGQKSFSAFEV